MCFYVRKAQPRAAWLFIQFKDLTAVCSLIPITLPDSNIKNKIPHLCDDLVPRHVNHLDLGSDEPAQLERHLRGLGAAVRMLRQVRVQHLGDGALDSVHVENLVRVRAQLVRVLQLRRVRMSGEK